MTMRIKGAPRRRRHLNAYLSEEEYEKMLARFKTTTCRSLGEFARDRLTGQPETIFYRCQSADDFLPIAISLRNELMAIGNEIRQIILKLQLMQPSPDLRLAITTLDAWLFAFTLKTEEIKQRLDKIYQQWLQE